MNSIEPPQKLSKLQVSYSKSNFTFHTFHADYEESTILFEVIQLKESLFIWIGSQKNSTFNSLSLAMCNRYDTEPISTSLIGGGDMSSRNISLKLCKKLKKPVYASVNVDDGKFKMLIVEKRLFEEIKKFPEKF